MTCKDCIHYEPCYEYGNILDPLGGGVKCDSFKNKADFVEVKHGKWIITDHTEYGVEAKCSECGYEVIFGRCYIGKYCPDCGAKMDGGNN